LSTKEGSKPSVTQLLEPIVQLVVELLETARAVLGGQPRALLQRPGIDTSCNGLQHRFRDPAGGLETQPRRFREALRAVRSRGRDLDQGCVGQDLERRNVTPACELVTLDEELPQDRLLGEVERARTLEANELVGFEAAVGRLDPGQTLEFALHDVPTVEFVELLLESPAQT
jgi:hypothetical protein